jgi:hypothetical protein
VRVIKGATAARQTLLRRAPNDDPALPPAAREAVRRVFGAELDAGAVVDRILRDVRQNGDAAIRAYDEAIDGIVSDKPLALSREEIEAAYAGRPAWSPPAPGGGTSPPTTTSTGTRRARSKGASAGRPSSRGSACASPATG